MKKLVTIIISHYLEKVNPALESILLAFFSGNL